MYEIIFVLIYGILVLVHSIDSRAVNITNSWTLPQEDFGVFYRFFRDKISWFEADAVCQFHHASLVTVNNGLQFDAARAFLKELDVNEPVWIGLMRPQGVDKFSWTNSKPLSLTSDYWAESLPIPETPLCAVIDPAQDFRWHGLHCGGPEIASFLCEMNVPTWATNCSIRAMPSLTIQYMSDSGAIQLSRDCGDDGTRHMICHGKEDHESIIKQLTCSDENNYTENNVIKLEADLAIKKIIIKPISSEKNKEIFSNKIDENSNRIEMIETMQSDQPVIEKSNRKFKKFVKKLIANKKDKTVQKTINDELMQGDQPIGSIQDVLIDESQFVEILPQKSISPLPFTNNEKTENTKISINPLMTTPETIDAHSTSIETTQATIYLNSLPSSITEGEFVTDTNYNILSPINEKLTTSNNENSLSDNVTKRAIISIENNAHPMHAPKDIIKHTKNDFMTTHTSHTKHESKTNIVGNDHFIPPMLLLKAKFTSRPHSHEHTENLTIETTTSISTLVDHLNFTLEPTEIENNIEAKISLTLTSAKDNLEFPTTSTEHKIVDGKVEDLNFLNNSDIQIGTVIPNEIFSSDIDTHLDGKILEDDRIVENILDTDLPMISSENKIKYISLENNFSMTSLPIMSIKNTTEPPLDLTRIFTLTDINTVTNKITTMPPEIKGLNEEKPNIIVPNNLPILSSIISTNISIDYTSNPIIYQNTSNIENFDSSKSTQMITTSTVDINTETTNKHNDYENSFSNIENFQPYKPNRRRSLIKIDAISHSYIKKILG